MSILDNRMALKKHRKEALTKEVELSMALHKQFKEINEDIHRGIKYLVLVGDERTTKTLPILEVEYFMSNFNVVLDTNDRANKIDDEYIIDIFKG